MTTGTSASPMAVLACRRSHACAATINFVDFLEPVLLAPYLDSVLSAALGVIRTGPRIAQEQAVALVSSACMVMEDQLGDKQYSMLMPFFKQALGQCPNEDEFRMLKVRAQPKNHVPLTLL